MNRRLRSVDRHARAAFTGAETGMIMTTVVLIAAFSRIAFSGMRDQRIFVTMGGLTLLAALFVDLVFLPALLRFARRK